MEMEIVTLEGPSLPKPNGLLSSLPDTASPLVGLRVWPCKDGGLWEDLGRVVEPPLPASSAFKSEKDSEVRMRDKLEMLSKLSEPLMIWNKKTTIIIHIISQRTISFRWSKTSNLEIFLISSLAKYRPFYSLLINLLLLLLCF